MLLETIFSEQCDNRSFHRLFIEKAVKAHQLTLKCISRPHPTVTLYPVDEKFPRCQRQRVFGNPINLVQLFVATLKRRARL